MRRRTAQVLSIASVAVLAACDSPVAPEPFSAAGDSGRPGYTLTILSASPAAGSTIDRRQGSALARVRVEFERPAGATEVRLTVCLARDTSTLIVSSCRDTRLPGPRGEAEGYAGVYLVNGVPAWSETRYILASLVAGDLVPDRRTYEDEVGIGRLSRDVFASWRLEHVLYWR